MIDYEWLAKACTKESQVLSQDLIACLRHLESTVGLVPTAASFPPMRLERLILLRAELEDQTTPLAQAARHR